MENIFFGAGSALVTPFKNDHSIDFDALKKFVRYQINEGIDFLVVQGTTGESPTLSWSEKLEILAAVVEENKGAKKVVFGLGGNNTLDICKKMKELPTGIDGILSVSPYYNKPIQAGVIQHFTEIAKNTDLPIILYNVPGRTGSNMTSDTTLELAKISNIVAVKEASGNMEQVMDIIRRRPPSFGVLSGDDAITMPLIAAGADGVISVVSNAFPAKFTEMVRLALQGDFTKSRELHYELFEITQLFFAEGNPGGVKEALKALQLMENTMRLPLANVSDKLRNLIHNLTKQIA